MSGELNTDNTDATGFSQMAVDTAPSLGRVRGGSVPSFLLQRYCTKLAHGEIAGDSGR